MLERIKAWDITLTGTRLGTKGGLEDSDLLTIKAMVIPKVICRAITDRHLILVLAILMRHQIKGTRLSTHHPTCSKSLLTQR